MKLSASEPGIVVSSFAHAAVLVAALAGLWSPTPFDDHSEAIPVELISEAELRRITQGQKDARKVEPKPAPPALRTAAAPEAKAELPPAKPDSAAAPPPPPPPEPKPEPPVEARVEPPPPPPAPEPPARPPARSAAAPEPKPPEPPKPAVVIPPEPPKDAEVIRPAPPKPPEVKKPEPKPKPAEKPKVVAKPTPKPVEDEEADEEKPKPAAKPTPKPTPKPDQIAKLIEAAPAAKPAPATPAAAAAKQAPAAPNAKPFDRSDIEKVLRASGQPPGGTPGPAAQQPQRAASLGAPTGRAEKLTPSDRDALIGIVSEQLRRCWSLPPGTSPAYKPALAFAVSEEGVVTSTPTVTNPRSEAPFQATAASAVRAVQRCSRLAIPARFKPFHRDWARMVITFDPTDAL